MPARLLPAILMLVMMLVSPLLAGMLRPTTRVADGKPPVDLESMIPAHFADWQQDLHSNISVANPQQTELLNQLYGQLLSRTYINNSGYRIMLSIAYGGNQSDAMQVHRPEVCYQSQGFALWSTTSDVMATSVGTVPVTKLVASLGQRYEPVTYWTTVGETAVKTGIHKKLIEMEYRLTGTIPDGLLFRVSSIDGDSMSAFELQAQFIDQLLQSVKPGDLSRLAGISPSRQVNHD
jgi:EpsI family protein